MITTETGAYQEMCEALRTVVGSADVKALLGYTPEIRYVDKEYKNKPANEKVWLRITLIQGGEKKRTLSVPSRKTKQGVCDVQQFVPVTHQDAAEVGRKLADLLMAVYAKSTASVDFMLAGIKDMPREDAWFYKRVYATYNYDTYQ